MRIFLISTFIIWAFAANCQLNILAIGDSHGAAENGWVNQLQALRPTDKVINTAISGNTIGFDNLQREELNTQKNIKSYILKGQENGNIDEIFIMLGTNDCKKVFEHHQHSVHRHLLKVIHVIKELTPTSSITILTPPPMGEDSLLKEKYHGGKQRVESLVWQYFKLANEEVIEIIDIHSMLKSRFKDLHTDGVHMNEKGYGIIAKQVHKQLKMKYTSWDETNKSKWPSGYTKISVRSSLDGDMQPAYFRRSKGVGKKPLIVSLHTWSGDYAQSDKLTKIVTELNFNYIHPNFRGPNYTEKAMGSEYVIQDIDDAITFAIQNGNVDQKQIYVVGASGGGYATLLTYCKSKFNINTFYSWVPISDIKNWYYESQGRGNKYAQHILDATHSDHDNPDTTEMKKRSPMYMGINQGLRHLERIHIFAGVHDGYTGSVPVTHSMDFFNKVSATFGDHSKIRPNERAEILKDTRLEANDKSDAHIGDHKIWLKKETPHASITLFEGGHEMVIEYMEDELRRIAEE